MYDVVDHNLRTAMRCYSNISDKGEAREYPGLTVASTGLDVAVFNSAMLTQKTESLDAQISVAEVHFGARKLGWSFWVCEDLLGPDLRSGGMRDAFRRQRLFSVASAPGMYAEKLEPPRKSLPAMRFRQVADDHTRLEFAHIASIVFSLALPTSQQIYGSSGLWCPPTHGWIGYVEQNPVSVVTVVIAGGAIGVYSLGTLPSYQGRGFGEALLRHAVAEASRQYGVERTVLQATPQGLHLYTRIGYRIVTKFSIFIREGRASF